MALKENMKHGDIDEFFNRFIKLPCYHHHYVEKYYDQCLHTEQLEMDYIDSTTKCQLLWDGYRCIIQTVETNLGSQCRQDEDTVTTIKLHSSDIWNNFRINATNCLQSVLTEQGPPDVSPSSSVLPLLIGCTAGGLVAVLMIIAIILIYRRRNKNNEDTPQYGRPRSRQSYRDTLERTQCQSNTLPNTYHTTPVYYTNGVQVNQDMEGYEIAANTINYDSGEDMVTEEIYEEIKSENEYESPWRRKSSHTYDRITDDREELRECMFQETVYIESPTRVNTEDNEQYMDMSGTIYVNDIRGYPEYSH